MFTSELGMHCYMIIR